MTLFTELQERWKAIFLERESVEKRADELAEDMQELEVALVALQGLHAPIADEQLRVSRSRVFLNWGPRLICKPLPARPKKAGTNSRKRPNEPQP